MFKDKKTRNDIILGLAVIILAAGIWLFTELMKEDGSFAVVTVNGTESSRYSLDEDAEIRLESENGGYNILVIKNGKADITESIRTPFTQSLFILYPTNNLFCIT